MGKKINGVNKKIAIVTGGSRGIGKAIASQLLHDGYKVYICAQEENELKRTASDLGKSGEVEYFVLDLADKEAIKSFTAAWNKPIKVLVNNAGIYTTEKLDEDRDVWDKVLNVNLNGPYWLTKGLIKHIEDNGRIINISSQLGKEGRAGAGAYSASKFGLIGLTKCWAKELGVRGITVNAICPGWVKTEMLKHDFDKAAKEKGLSFEEYEKQICQPLELKRMTEPEEVADLVSFLASDKARAITGRDMLMNTIWNRE